MFRFIWIPFGLGLLLSGCATTNRIALTPQAKSGLSSAQPIVGLNQQEIAADINRSNVSAITGGGLIGGLIDAAVDNSRAKKAETTVTPIRDAILDYNVGEHVSGELKTALAGIPWLQAQNVSVQIPATKDVIKGLVDRASTDAVLFLDVQYRFSANFGNLTVTVDANLFSHKPSLTKTSEKSRDGLPVVYSNTLGVTVALPNSGPVDAKSAVDFWAANKGAAARTALDLAARELAKMLAFDLQEKQDDAAETKAAATKEVVLVAGGRVVAGVAMKAALVRDEGDRSWVRAVNGQLWSVANK